jgi:imidazole glycerol phosphate synthase subunit HisF
MLKTRIIAVLVVKGGIVVQSIGFKRYLPVGTPAIAVEHLNRWGVDEIVLLDIDATSIPVIARFLWRSVGVSRKPMTSSGPFRSGQIKS